jgi:hypothetical protein
MVSSLAGPLGAMSLTKQCHGRAPGLEHSSTDCGLHQDWWRQVSKGGDVTSPHEGVQADF